MTILISTASLRLRGVLVVGAVSALVGSLVADAVSCASTVDLASVVLLILSAVSAAGASFLWALWGGAGVALRSIAGSVMVGVLAGAVWFGVGFFVWLWIDVQHCGLGL